MSNMDSKMQILPFFHGHLLSCFNHTLSLMIIIQKSTQEVYHDQHQEQRRQEGMSGRSAVPHCGDRP